MTELKLRIERYRPNALIFIEGNKTNDTFYILKSGQVAVSRIHEITEDSNTVLKAGDPFGVVSCLANRPRLESVRTLTETEVIAVRRDQIIPLLQKNPGVGLKILRWFSRRLREYDAALARMALKKPVVEDTSLIRNVGDHYHRQRKFRAAHYCYTRFLHLLPDHPDAAEVRQRLESILRSYPDAATPYTQTDDVTRTYPDKSMLFCEHEPGEEVFIIQKGRVQIAKIVGDKELLLAVSGPGDVVGEMAILEDKPRNASAIAIGNVTVLVMNRRNFLHLVQSNPQTVHKILTLLSERIWIAYRQFENLAIKDDYKRLLDCAMIQLEKQKVNLDANAEYHLGLTPAELVLLAGLDEAKTDELTERLLDDPLFTLYNGHVVIKDLPEFVKQVESIRKFQLSGRGP